MLCLRQSGYFIKMTIILLVSGSSTGFPTWSIEEENPLFRGIDCFQNFKRESADLQIEGSLVRSTDEAYALREDMIKDIESDLICSPSLRVGSCLRRTGSSKGFPNWSIEEENPLFRDSLLGDLTLNDDLYNLLKKALTLKFGPENYMDHIDYMSGLKSDDLSNRVMSPPSLEQANSKLWDEMDDPKYEQFSSDNKDMEKKRSDINSICQKGNVFGSWLNKLCNERRSG